MESQNKDKNTLRVSSLYKSFGKKSVVKGVDFSMQTGEVLGLLGPNGAGKSTTIRTLLGLIKKDAGKARIFGREIGSNKDFEYILKDVGYMPSEAMFYPEMKVSDTIKFAANVRRKDCDNEARMLCEKLQLDVNKKIEELSLGNRKKVSIVCAMQHKPKLFVFDEPTSGLDPLMQAEFFELINEYVKNGATCMLSTHVLSEVKNYCKHVGIMKEGKLLKVDEVSNITKTNAKKIKIVRNGKLQEFIYKGDIKEIYKEIQGDDIDDVLIEDPSLDEIFMHYYQ